MSWEEAGAGNLQFVSNVEVSVVDTLTDFFFAQGVLYIKSGGGREGEGGTNEVAAMKADDDGMFARLDVFRDEDVDCDGVVVDGLVCDVLDIKSGESVLDGCDLEGIHADV